MKNIKNYISAFALAVGLAFSSCTGDLDVTPIDPNMNTSDKALTTAEDFKAFLAYCYVGFSTSGYEGPNGSPSISGLDGGFSQYFRGLFHLNEYTTDETVIGWNDQTIKDLHGLAWTSTDVFVSSLYYRILYQVSMCNEFLRQANTTSVQVPDMEKYKAEVRTLRALCWLHAIDMFGNVPFADETSSVGSTNPERIGRAELFDWLEIELKDIIDNSALPNARQNEYGRIDKGAAKMILAKLYLNAEIYAGKAKWNECAQVCQSIMADGYSLHPNYQELFLADNHQCTDEIIFAFEQDGIDTQSYGVTNFIIFASTGGSIDPASIGISSGWGGIRTTPEFYDSFQEGDERSLFHTEGQQKEIDNIGEFTHGYAFMKFKNINSDGTPGKANGFVDTDFPLFRYADVLLMLAECGLNGASGVTAEQGLAYLNQVRERAGLPAQSAYTEEDLVRERGCELYLECWRRSDLIRFDRFTTNKYLWSWKGGVKEGKAVGSHMNLFPIPDKDLNSNDNLTQNPGY